MRATSPTSNDAAWPIVLGNTVTFGVGLKRPGESPAMHLQQQENGAREGWDARARARAGRKADALCAAAKTALT